MIKIIICFIGFFAGLAMARAGAQLANDGINGFMQHWANYNADMQAAASELSAMQNDITDNSIEAQQLLQTNSSFNAELQSASTQLSQQTTIVAEPPTINNIAQ